MANRNMIKTAESFRKQFHEQSSRNKYLSSYDLSLEEINQLTEISETSLVNAICIAFGYGFVLGTRAKAKDLVLTL